VFFFNWITYFMIRTCYGIQRQLQALLELLPIAPSQLLFRFQQMRVRVLREKIPTRQNTQKSPREETARGKQARRGPIGLYYSLYLLFIYLYLHLFHPTIASVYRTTKANHFAPFYYSEPVSRTTETLPPS
jgi:hypothetical protein